MAELANRASLESDFARRMSRLSAEHKRELVRLLGNPPDPSRVTDADWQRWEEEDRNELLLILLLIFIAAAEQHAELGGGDVPTLLPALTATGTAWATQQAATIASGMAANSRDMLGLAGRTWEETQRAGGAVTRAEVQDVGVRIFGPSRAEGVAVTETTNAQTAGGDAGIEATVGIGPDDLWWTAQDDRVCIICGPLHGTPRSEWEAYFPTGPAAHPRCRCELIHANVAAEIQVTR